MRDTHATVRPAESRDAGDIARLITLLGYPCTPEQMQARLAAMAQDGCHATFVAEIGGAVVGMAGAFVGRIYEEDAPVGRLLALGVDEELRGQGVGALLLRYAEGWMKTRGAEKVLVNSGNHREQAHRFYETAGYAWKGRSFVKPLTKN